MAPPAPHLSARAVTSPWTWLAACRSGSNVPNPLEGLCTYLEHLEGCVRQEVPKPDHRGDEAEVEEGKHRE